jgi:hypothetical protein
MWQAICSSDGMRVMALMEHKNEPTQSISGGGERYLIFQDCWTRSSEMGVHLCCVIEFILP